MCFMKIILVVRLRKGVDGASRGAERRWENAAIIRQSYICLDLHPRAGIWHWSVFKVGRNFLTSGQDERYPGRKLPPTEMSFPFSLFAILSPRQPNYSPQEAHFQDPFEQFTRLFITSKEKAWIIKIKSSPPMIWGHHYFQPPFPSTFSSILCKNKVTRVWW